MSVGKKLRPRLQAARAIERTRILSALVAARRACWLRLYRDPEVWTNGARREAMLSARRAYHKVLHAYLDALEQTDALLAPVR
jgi:hypothetical protein